MMADLKQNLIKARNKAINLFEIIKPQIKLGMTEKQITDLIYAEGEKLYGIQKHWHKKIARIGENTLCPYKDNPANLALKEDDIIFLDFGPVFEDNCEADLGRTIVFGNDELKLKLKKDLELAFTEAKNFYQKNINLTGAEFYEYIYNLAIKYGWKYGSPYAGHLIGNFPHEQILGDNPEQYIHPENHELMSNLDKFNQPRYWILEIHFIDEKNKFGGFYEDLLNCEL